MLFKIEILSCNLIYSVCIFVRFASVKYKTNRVCLRSASIQADTSKPKGLIIKINRIKMRSITFNITCFLKRKIVISPLSNYVINIIIRNSDNQHANSSIQLFVLFFRCVYLSTNFHICR